MAYQPFDLSGKVCLVTGGNGGIGLGMAEALAQAGSSVVLWGTNPKKNKQAVEKILSIGGNAIAKQVDVGNEAAVASAMNDCVEEMGRLDTVIANAGIGIYSPSFLEMKSEDMNKIFEVNLLGALFTLREAAKHMVSRAQNGDAGGSLVGVASLAALEGAAHNQHYSASKAGLTAAVRSCAVEFARYGIRANSILPGWIATEMTEAAHLDEKFNEKVISRVPMRRWGMAQDFGGIAVYLASDASKFHTGDSIVVDGGYAIF